ncbi:Rho termination factor [Arsenicicoccus sp. MKL-02]|uniref:Rho termination factor n=1 Tax=Arsenicicoccus cauae TaxID=2663847 RepID=A0A6I3I7Q4_9MICO|nr:Rho termination factor N-terminal domain-containing protein [Arsenicicoccus cauae]MTB72184.1 Rho termination factor [Arsenicicoccus cauae]
MAPSEDASKDQRQDDPGPSVRDKELYETLRDEGNSKEKSARIANAAAAQGRSTVGARGGEHGSYDDWTKDELLDRAREVGIEGRSSMNKDELIDALREH